MRRDQPQGLYYGDLVTLPVANIDPLEKTAIW
jgi:hypothetical protein